MIYEDNDLTIAVLATAVVLIAVSVLMLRRRQRMLRPGWVPWNGVLFVSIIVMAVALAHFFGVKGR